MNITPSELSELLDLLMSLCGARAPASDLAVLQNIILTELKRMSDAFATEITKLQGDVAAQSTVISSATTAFQGLAAQLAAAEAAAKAAGATDAQIASVAAVRQGLETNTAALAAAIPQNTPAATTDATGRVTTGTAEGQPVAA